MLRAISQIKEKLRRRRDLLFVHLQEHLPQHAPKRSPAGLARAAAGHALGNQVALEQLQLGGFAGAVTALKGDETNHAIDA
jgi:hypothetical protein